MRGLTSVNRPIKASARKSDSALPPSKELRCLGVEVTRVGLGAGNQTGEDRVAAQAAPGKTLDFKGE